MIRMAEIKDISRIAEIAVFGKRLNYRRIFSDDDFSFNKLQVLTEVELYRELLSDIWVFEEDGIVKAFIHIDGTEIKELYVDHFFQSRGIGSRLLVFAVKEKNAELLWVLENNQRAISFYERNGFCLSAEKCPIDGTGRYKWKMILAPGGHDR